VGAGKKYGPTVGDQNALVNFQRNCLPRRQRIHQNSLECDGPYGVGKEKRVARSRPANRGSRASLEFLSIRDLGLSGDLKEPLINLALMRAKEEGKNLEKVREEHLSDSGRPPWKHTPTVPSD